MEAARVLNPGGLKLYLYLASNADGFNLELSPAAILEKLDIKKSTYYNAINTLEDLGYINLIQGNIYQFTTTPVSKNLEKKIDSKNLEKMVNSKKLESGDKKLPIFSKNLETAEVSKTRIDKKNENTNFDVSKNLESDSNFLESDSKNLDQTFQKITIEIDKIDKIDKIDNVRLFDKKRKEELREDVSDGGYIKSKKEWIIDRFHHFRQEPHDMQIHRLFSYGYSAEEAEFIVREILSEEKMERVERSLGIIPLEV